MKDFNSCLVLKQSCIDQQQIFQPKNGMNYKHLQSFVRQYQLKLDESLMRHLLILGINTALEKLSPISNESIRQAAKKLKQVGGEERIRNELEKIKSELGKLAKHFDPKPDDSQSRLMKTTSDISSQEQLKWWSSPQAPARHTEHCMLPPQGPSRSKKRDNCLTPKVTESPAPPLQMNKISFKHHLDDSEIKKTLWDNPQATDPCESICSSHQSFHNNRGMSPSFKVNDSIHEQLPLRTQQSQQTIKQFEQVPQPPKKPKNVQKREKENMKPQKGVQQLTSRNSVKSARKRKSWSVTKRDSNNNQNNSLRNVQSKIKDQVDMDRQAHRLRVLEAQLYNQEDTIHTIHTESEDYNPDLQDKQPTYTTFQMRSNEDQPLSNRNPMISVNTKPQTEEAVQYRQVQLDVPNDTAHHRYISQITSHNSQETTPGNRQYRDLYSQAMTAQSVFLQSDVSNPDRRVSPKGRFRSEMRSEVLSGRDVLSKLTSERKHLSQQISHKPIGSDDIERQKKLKEILSYHDYNSSISSNFSLFNPKDEFKSFFQNEFTSDRKFLSGRQAPIYSQGENSSNISFNTESRSKRYLPLTQN